MSCRGHGKGPRAQASHCKTPSAELSDWAALHGWSLHVRLIRALICNPGKTCMCELHTLYTLVRTGEGKTRFISTCEGNVTRPLRLVAGAGWDWARALALRLPLVPDPARCGESVTWSPWPSGPAPGGGGGHARVLALRAPLVALFAPATVCCGESVAWPSSAAPGCTGGQMRVLGLRLPVVLLGPGEYRGVDASSSFASSTPCVLAMLVLVKSGMVKRTSPSPLSPPPAANEADSGESPVVLLALSKTTWLLLRLLPHGQMNMSWAATTIEPATAPKMMPNMAPGVRLSEDEDEGGADAGVGAGAGVGVGVGTGLVEGVATGLAEGLGKGLDIWAGGGEVPAWKDSPFAKLNVHMWCKIRGC